jgi:hypothetical protein
MVRRQAGEETMSKKQNILITIAVLCLTLLFNYRTAIAAPLTKFIIPLTEHAKKIESLQQQLSESSSDVKLKPPDENLKLTCEELHTQTEELRVTLHKFVNAQTRRGTRMEFELIEESVNAVQNSVGLMFVLCDKKLSELMKPPKISDILIKDILRKLVEKELTKRGLDALVGVKSRRDVRNRIVAIIIEKYKETAQDVTERFAKMRFYDIPSAREALKIRLRQRLTRLVEKINIRLFGKASTIEVYLVVSFFEKTIYPELREWLRPKGNVHNRTKRSVATLKESTNELSALGHLNKKNKKITPDLENLNKVRRALNRAKWRIDASRYLVRDLPKPDVVPLTEKKGLAIKIQKSKIEQFNMQLPKPGYEDKATRQQLANWLYIERERLRRNMHVTKYRFMLENLDKVKKVAEYEALVKLLSDILRRLINSSCFDEEEFSDTDAFGIEHEE